MGKSQKTRYIALMAILLFLFILGTANFAMHKAVMESGHPAIQGSRAAFNKATGGWGGYILEYFILVVAMNFAYQGFAFATGAYIGYTMLNAGAAWMLLSGKF